MVRSVAVVVRISSSSTTSSTRSTVSSSSCNGDTYLNRIHHLIRGIDALDVGQAQARTWTEWYSL